MCASVQHSGREPAIRESDHTSTIFVAYHFFPSTEVGARQISAVARYLTAQGRAVAVISAFAGLVSFTAATLAACDLEHVPDRKSEIDAFPVTGKKLLRSIASVASRAKRSSPMQSDSADGHRRQTGRSAFHRALFSVVRVIDDKRYRGLIDRVGPGIPPAAVDSSHGD
jgi:hypothetical protein